jgi:iron(III) transport system substrate-binding protein
MKNGRYANSRWRKICATLLAGLACGMLTAVASGAENAEVVVYTALDQFYSEPILKEFEKKTGIAVRPRFDTEATKTTGLFNRIVAERRRPRCDVFWNNEVLLTVALKRLRLLEPYKAPTAGDIPTRFKDSEGYWTGFAARARVVVYNTELLTSSTAPQSILDFADAKWKGRTAMAYPLFGTTRTHSAALFARWGEKKARAYFESLEANDIRILDGNAMVCRAVGRGEFLAGFTDTDDVHSMKLDGLPVDFLLPDQGPDALGALLIPNTLCLIKDSPNPEAGKQLIDFLLQKSIEGRLAEARSAQIPVRDVGVYSGTGIRLGKVELMPFDYEKAEREMEGAVRFLQRLFVR